MIRPGAFGWTEQLIGAAVLVACVALLVLVEVVCIPRIEREQARKRREEEELEKRP
jgi:hypothetical protein